MIPTIHFDYDKKQVVQALRYHFLTRPEIKILLVMVNVFAIMSAVLFALNKIQPIAFLLFSSLWFLLMFSIWIFLPRSIYKKAHTFQDDFSMSFRRTRWFWKIIRVPKPGPGNHSASSWKVLIFFISTLITARFSSYPRMPSKISYSSRIPENY